MSRWLNENLRLIVVVICKNKLDRLLFVLFKNMGGLYLNVWIEEVFFLSFVCFIFSCKFDVLFLWSPSVLERFHILSLSDDASRTSITCVRP